MCTFGSICLQKSRSNKMYDKSEIGKGRSGIIIKRRKEIADTDLRAALLTTKSWENFLN
jgi:hypothetical protein